jgi:oxaloacetate decarboxylase gamma subunit
LEKSLLDEGLSLMMVGMGTVFVFLTLLVMAMMLLSNVVTRFSPGQGATVASDEEVAVIAAAMAQHRHNKLVR